MWLAQVGRERIEETIDPELTIERALEACQRKGYSREWINQRLQAIQVCKELTDEWDARGVPVITSQNAAQLNQVVTDMIEGVASKGEFVLWCVENEY